MRIMRSKSGEKLYRDMRVRVVLPGQKDITWKARAKPGTGYGEAQLDEMLDAAVKRADLMWPSIEFRLVELAPNDLKFIYDGRKDMPEKRENPCPSGARSPEIAALLCAVQGHSIGVYQDGIEITPQGAVPKAIKFCTKCGFGLSEIRGDMDAVFNQAVMQTAKALVNQVASANNPQVSSGPQGEPGAGPFPIDGAREEKATAASAD